MSESSTTVTMSEFKKRYCKPANCGYKISAQGLQEFQAILTNKDALNRFLDVENVLNVNVEQLARDNVDNSFSYSSSSKLSYGKLWDEAHERIRHDFVELLTSARHSSLEAREMVVAALCTPIVHNFIYSVDFAFRDRLEIDLVSDLSHEEKVTILRASLDQNLTFPRVFSKHAMEILVASDAADQAAILASEGSEQAFRRFDTTKLKVSPRTVQNLRDQLTGYPRVAQQPSIMSQNP